MGAKLTVAVKDEGIISKIYGPTIWFINLFKKFPLDVYVNGEKTTVQANTEKTYLLEPGLHTLKVVDPRQDLKIKWYKITKIFIKLMIELPFRVMGIPLDLSTGGSSDFNYNNGEYTIELNEGDDINIVCRSNVKGDVKVKEKKAKK